MGGDEAMRRVIAGIGFRADIEAGDIVAVVREAVARAGCAADALAVPDFKAHEAGVRAAADALGLPIILVPRAALQGAQGRCLTRSAAAQRATGLASVAEAAALAAGGAAARLLLPRVSLARATCALAEATA